MDAFLDFLGLYRSDVAKDGSCLFRAVSEQDPDLSWNSDRPLLTDCFRNIALSCVPCSVLWLSTALDVAFAGHNRGHKCGPYPWTTLSICKLILTSLLITCSFIQGAYNLYRYGSDSEFRDVFISIGVKLITYVLALCLQIRQRRSGQLTSLKLTLFWNLMALCELFASPIYELVMNNLLKRTDELNFIVGTLAFCLVASEAFVSHFTDPQYDLFFADPKTDEYLVDHQAPLSRLLFTWLNRLMWFGYKNVLSLEDLDTLRPDCRTTHVCDTFIESWSKEVDKNGWGGTFLRPSLCLALARVIWPWMLFAALLELTYDFLILVPPILLDWLISFVSDPTEPSWHGPVYAFLFFLASASSSLLMVHNQNFLIRASVVPRSGLNAAIYRKVFQLSLDSRRRYSLGELCNLVTVDAQRIFELVWSVNSLWSNPLRIALIVALLWRYLGPACLAGVAALLAIMPATALLAVWTQRIQKTQMDYKDTRLRLMNEILNGIKVLKLFAWELPFVRRVEEVRFKETKSLRKLAFLNSVVVFLWILAPFLVALCSFVTFILIDENNVLDPATAFVSLSLFSRLRGSMSTVPQIISEVVRSRIAFRRVISFLLSDEMNSICTEEEQEAPSPGKILEMEGAHFSWGGEEEDFLQGVDLSVRQGELVAVVGQVGAGKSALISAIVGEMTRTQGSFKMEKDLRVAVVPQTAWIQNATLRQNVLFVSPMDKRRYDSVVKRCCLKPDMKTLPGGDHTEIGEKGVNLSGGQKQRVNLARALYHDADLYLLDDPMSAVDAHISSRIFDDVIGPKGMLAQKTRILVTHDLSVLPRCDKVVVLRQGRVVESGSYRQLMALAGGELARMSYDLAKQSENPTTPDALSAAKSEQDLFHRTISKDGAQVPKGGRLIESERMEIGRVQTGVYWTYFRSAGFTMTLLMFTGFAAHQTFEIFSNVWLSFWSMDAPLPNGSQNIPLQNWRMSVYGILGLAQGACILTGVVVLAIASTRASVRLHKSMLWSVIHSPLSFFETTPMGRILNRFGKDMESVDVAIPSGLSSVASTLVSAVGVLVVICVNHPLFLLIMVPIAILYIFFQLFYVATSRQLRRLQSVSLSPVLSFFSETVQGLSTLHAYDCKGFFTDCYESLVDSNCKVFLNTTFVNRWLGVHLELMAAVIVLIVALLSVLQRSDYSAALIGLTLSYALNVTDLLRLMVRLMTQLETRMVSVERIDEYSKLEEEGSWCTEERSLSLENWPNEGTIVFKNYKMRYRTGTELVLKGIDLQIPGGQKVGIVGRTGAGKTSLAQALFRVVEATSGQLIIDGLDVARLGLHDLRNKITVIPQDPVLFEGDLRLNLDPTKKHADEEVYEAMNLAHLDLTDLNTRLDEGGANLSVGQRQQVCLARAILRKSQILVLDEATAAIDTETDRLIQEMLRTEFANCTLLTVAHRLNTVLDYDRILVMDNGRVVEDGPPDILLKKKNSLFRDLARSAGLL